MSAVPVAVRRIRRRVSAEDMRSGSMSAAADAFAISAQNRVVHDQVGVDLLVDQVG